MSPWKSSEITCNFLLIQIIIAGSLWKWQYKRNKTCIDLPKLLQENTLLNVLNKQNILLKTQDFTTKTDTLTQKHAKAIENVSLN